MYESFQWFT